MSDIIAKHLEYPLTATLLKQAKRNKDLNLSIPYSCSIAETSLNITTKGECFVDNCEMYLPFSVCNIMEVDKLENVWDSPCAKALQKDIDDKKYTYCAVEHCGILSRDQHWIDDNGEKFYSIYVNIDDSCNLACPSCRKEPILITKGPIFEERLKMAHHVIRLLENFDKKTHITLTGNGDPLASNIMRPLVLDWIPRHNHSITLFTNGLLMSKQLPESKILDHISEFKISMDAGSKEVYEDVRRPGKWEKLIENLDWLQHNAPEHSTKFFRFVAQKANASDVENFVELCQRYNAKCSITKLDDWGTMENFTECDVVDNVHVPFREEFFRQIKNVMNEPGVFIPDTILKYVK